MKEDKKKKKRVSKKNYKTIIIQKSSCSKGRDSLTLFFIKKTSEMWSLKEEDIVKITEYESSYHIKIRKETKYVYYDDANSVKKKEEEGKKI